MVELFRYDAQILPEITFCGRQAVDEPFRNIRRVSGDYIFYLVTEGDVYLEEDGISYHLQRGDCFLLEPGKLHLGTQFSFYKLYYIHFRHPKIRKEQLGEQELMEQLQVGRSAWQTSMDSGPFPDEGIPVFKWVRLENKTDLAMVCNLVEHMLDRQEVHLEHYNILNSCAVSEIFIEIQRRYVTQLLQMTNRGAERYQRVNMVLLYLNANYRRKLTGEVIERELSYNFDYLNQLFRQHLHISIFKMLENIRMETAKDLLQTRPLTIKQIANEVGYSDDTYFTKVFKQHTGTTPAKYRKNGRTSI